MQRKMGTFALMMTGLGSIIGSGWLFGAWKASTIAGPSAIYSWIIGMIIILFIALTYAELGAMFPQAGGMVKFPQYSHGSFVGFLAGWSNWISIASTISVEAVASVQYMSTFPWEWATWTHSLVHDGTLTASGIFAASILLLIYFFLNFWTVNLFSKANNIISTLKIIIPGITVATLLYAGFHSSNFAVHDTNGVGSMASVFTAVATSGIVFAFNGFQSPINMAGEAKTPSRSIPIAVIGSIFVALIIYLLLQVAFLGAVDPRELVHGWSHLNFNSPFADLAIAINLQWLAIVLYADAFISPSGTGATYMATTGRMLYGMEKNGYLPKVLGTLHPKYGIPRPAMIVNLIVCFIFLIVFRGWGTLADVISVATLLSYVMGPVALMTLRRTGKNLHRPFYLKGAAIVAPIGFILASLALYWASWPLNGKVMLIIAIGLPIYFYYQAKNGFDGFKAAITSGIWLIVYLAAMTVIAYIGSERFGGLNILHYGWDMLLIAVLAVGFYIWGVRSGQVNPSTAEAEEVNHMFFAEAAATKETE